MTSRDRAIRHVVAVPCLSLALILCTGRSSDAQTSGAGFLFGPPTGAISIRGGLDRANAASDLFVFVTDELTLSRSDFRSATVAGDVTRSLTPRMAVVFAAAFSRTKTPSE